MAKKIKGLSFDEKKSVLAAAMRKEASFYTMKELENVAKKHGVIPQSVKEVVDCLIGDRVVIQEKIGSLNMYVVRPFISRHSRFWAFSSGEQSDLRNKIVTIESEIASLRIRKESRTQALSEQKSAFPAVTLLSNAESRKELSSLQERKADLELKLNELLKRDPETVARLVRHRQELKSEINMWTDNIFILRQYICSKLGVNAKVVNEEFGIPEDLDLIDD